MFLKRTLNNNLEYVNTDYILKMGILKDKETQKWVICFRLMSNEDIILEEFETKEQALSKLELIVQDHRQCQTVDLLKVQDFLIQSKTKKNLI